MAKFRRNASFFDRWGQDPDPHLAEELVGSKKLSDAIKTRLWDREQAFKCKDRDLPDPPIVWHRILFHPTIKTADLAHPITTDAEDMVVNIIQEIERQSDGKRHTATAAVGDKNRAIVELWDGLRDALRPLATGATFCLLDDKMRPSSTIRWGGQVVTWNKLFSDKGRKGLVSTMMWDPIKKKLVVMMLYRQRLLDGDSFDKVIADHRKQKN